MNKTEKRRKRKVHINKKTRKEIRKILFKRDGNLCCWCNKPMTDIYNCTSENIEDAATIEHYFAIKAGQSDNIDLLKLSHKRCNK